MSSSLISLEMIFEAPQWAIQIQVSYAELKIQKNPEFNLKSFKIRRIQPVTLFILADFYHFFSFETLKVCQKQGKKINKYKYRTDRVLKDILWHIIGVKRCNEFNWSGKY